MRHKGHVLILQVNKLSAALEDLSDEAVLLRRKAGLPPNEPLDTAGVKLQKDITIAQLRSVNSLLERQVRPSMWLRLASRGCSRRCHACSTAKVPMPRAHGGAYMCHLHVCGTTHLQHTSATATAGSQ